MIAQQRKRRSRSRTHTPADYGSYLATPRKTASVKSERIIPLALFTGSTRIFASTTRPGGSAQLSCQHMSGSKTACVAAMVRACAPARPVLTNACKGSSHPRDDISPSSPSPTRAPCAAGSYTPTTPATFRGRCGGSALGYQSKRFPHQQSLWPDGKHALGIRNDEWIKPLWSWYLMVRG